MLKSVKLKPQITKKSNDGNCQTVNNKLHTSYSC